MGATLKRIPAGVAVGMAALRTIAGPLATVAALGLAACQSGPRYLAAAAPQPDNTIREPTVTARLMPLGSMTPAATATSSPTATQTPTHTASPTPEPSRTQTLAPTATQTPTASITPSPTATPAPTKRRLTSGGCCVQPFWSPDGRQVLFIDRPTADGVTGIWGVGIYGGAPALVTQRLGVFSPDGRLLAYPSSDGRTYIGRTDGQKRWEVPSGGRTITFSPDSERIGWQLLSSPEPSYHRSTIDLWIANVNGSNPEEVISLTGGRLSGWFPDGNHWLLTGSDISSESFTLMVLDLSSGKAREIVRAPRLGGASISPQGDWVAFQVTVSGDAQRDGLWVARSDGSAMRKLGVYGSYQWRSQGLLAIVPLEVRDQSEVKSHRLLEVEVATGEVRPLTDPAQLSFRIANGDWSMAPDGEKMVYVSAEDHNLWLIELP